MTSTLVDFQIQIEHILVSDILSLLEFNEYIILRELPRQILDEDIIKNAQQFNFGDRSEFESRLRDFVNFGKPLDHLEFEFLSL